MWSRLFGFLTIDVACSVKLSKKYQRMILDENQSLNGKFFQVAEKISELKN